MNEALTGREMDVVVAEQVMEEGRPLLNPDICTDPIDDKPIGCAWVHAHYYERGDVCESEPRPFTTNIADAMRVVEKLRATLHFRCYTTPKGWKAEFDNIYSVLEGQFPTGYKSWRSENETLAEAICRAAVAAISNEGDSKR